MARSRCRAAAPSYWRALRSARPISRGVIDGRAPVVGFTLRTVHLHPHHAGPGRRGRLGDRKGHRQDLAADRDARALHGLSRRGRALSSLRALRRAATVGSPLRQRLDLDDLSQRARLSSHARDADGDPIFLGLRKFRAELARERKWLNERALDGQTFVFFKVTLDQKQESIGLQGGIAFCRWRQGGPGARNLWE